MVSMKMTPNGPVPMEKDEEAAFLAAQSQITESIATGSLIATAAAALKANDIVATRCVKASVPYPQEWLDYDRALRSIIDSGTGTIPAKPAYPAGT